ncbi:TPA: peptide deformylase [candidate division CPR2 bacterium]|uniref:Peptide deformylase n=1 Tax=candidate division CPR2 bacterium GW2011_GWC1_41_48 TaxID=1618344 RepID=A0A0G0W9L1_UNCC2|nr:MAG: peptide deformylase [candidate division CPR2 bacterium GW2011_GWC2_39_35]KKR29485.1 MAG: peptide deformylase [candidate division CPR2 bacterium GW2011_GWD2_39_7]KKR29710.1 MAG: peptide deformylase [candidate division CPR2 bacterium GW2011_GWD1_39_7]KKS09640.1 MAG: peptide deformylase [candidate division CPR2 bacterium GW2011_GWC1_41_48]OGB59495.1 MAG: peptide deformylase [candidate division CPR2 bacterium GWD1_39_7]OGB71742.1 MAG: peptide deformylase [candidate division CPR2 bacterium 
MAAKKIITLPDKILRSKSEEINDINSEILELAHEMADTIESYSSEYEAGVALAAVQIGIPKRMIVLKEDEEYIALINPIIIKKSKTENEDLEGCMSVPKKYGMIMRSKSIKVKAKNLEGKDIKIAAEGMFARILQHEIDHLNGILFTDYLKDSSQIYTLNSRGKLVLEKKV